MSAIKSALELHMQAEAERLIFEDPDPETGFLLHPDLKWVRMSSVTSITALCRKNPVPPVIHPMMVCIFLQDERQTEALYCIAMVNRYGSSSASAAACLSLACKLCSTCYALATSF